MQNIVLLVHRTNHKMNYQTKNGVKSDMVHAHSHAPESHVRSTGKSYATLTHGRVG